MIRLALTILVILASAGGLTARLVWPVSWEAIAIREESRDEFGGLISKKVEGQAVEREKPPRSPLGVDLPSGIYATKGTPGVKGPVLWTHGGYLKTDPKTFFLDLNPGRYSRVIKHGNNTCIRLGAKKASPRDPEIEAAKVSTLISDTVAGPFVDIGNRDGGGFFAFRNDHSFRIELRVERVAKINGRCP